MRSVSSIAKAYFKSVGLELKFRTVGVGSDSACLCIVDLIPSVDRLFTVSEPTVPGVWSGYLIDMKRGIEPDEPFESGSEHGLPGECGRTCSEAADRLLIRIRKVGWEVTEYFGKADCGTENYRCDCQCDVCCVGRKFVRRFQMPEFDSYEELDLQLSAKGY